MYKSFFHLHSTPFADSPDPRFLVRMAHTREALATLQYGISEHKGFHRPADRRGWHRQDHMALRSALASFDTGRIFSSFVFNPRLTPSVSGSLFSPTSASCPRAAPSPAC